MTSKLLIIYLLARVAETRVYYVDDSSVVRNNGFHYDDNNKNNLEQSSRDLDLSFSTGDNDNYAREIVPPFLRRVLTYGAPDRRDYDRANNYYKLIEIPEGRSKLEEVFSEPRRGSKILQSIGNRKGEVILELRVITNNDGM